MRTPFVGELLIWRGNTYRDGVVFKGSAKPPSQGGGVPALPNFGGFFSIYAYTLRRRTTKFHGKGLVLDGQPPSAQGGDVPALPNLGVSSYLCLYTIAELPLMAWQHMSGRCVYLGSAKPPITREWSFSGSRLWGSAVFCLQPFNTERPNSAW